MILHESWYFSRALCLTNFAKPFLECVYILSITMCGVLFMSLGKLCRRQCLGKLVLCSKYV